MEKIHTAWRFVFSNNPLYVEEINIPSHGDKYSYTQDSNKALKMTEYQCKVFANYMRDCGSVAYWC